jgi:hypothetical protein
LIYFRLVKSNPKSLLLSLFDIYASSESNNNNELVIHSSYLERISLLPVIEEYDANMMREHIRDIMLHVLGSTPVYGSQYLIKKSDLDLHLSQTQVDHENKPTLYSFLSKWQCLLWDRLPSELRLTVLDEVQLDSIRKAEAITQRAKLGQAYKIRYIQLLKHCILEWKKVTKYKAFISRFIRQKRLKKRQDFFYFWYYEYTLPLVNKRRKYILAETIGNYTIKARMFVRIRIHNYNNRRIMKYAGKYDQLAKALSQGLSHMRAFFILREYKKYFHRWWNECVEMINSEVAIAQHSKYLKVSTVTKWSAAAHAAAVERRMEVVTMENMMNFHRDMAEAEEAASLLAQMEVDKKLRAIELKQREKETAEANKMERLREARLAERLAERQLIISMHREERGKRVTAQMTEMRRSFEDRWRVNRRDYTAIELAASEKYLADKANEKVIKMRLMQLKKEFDAPPNFEYEAREAALKSIKNIAMVFLFMQLRLAELELHEFMKHYDNKSQNGTIMGESKGYLTVEEMMRMLAALEIPNLSKKQLEVIANEINGNPDEYITQEKVEEAMESVSIMGVPGSVWKFYIDPIQNIILYRNFETGESVLEHYMTEKIMNGINVADIKGEGKDRAFKRWTDTRAMDWERTIQSYMARRIQHMYHLKTARAERRKMLWKVDNWNLTALRAQEKQVMVFVERHIRGMLVRHRFKKQIYLSFEKVWDISSGSPFYFNHHQQLSTWEMPYYLRRYGDIANPLPWVVTQTADCEHENQAVYEYYNVPAKKAIPRKPDGLRICSCPDQIVGCSYFATRYCSTCDKFYCFTCHRNDHVSPFGFFQRRKPTPLEHLDPEFMSRVARISDPHPWTLIETPVSCELCVGSDFDREDQVRLAAFVFCNECVRSMCRICSRRVHAHGKFKDHSLITID